MNLKPGTPFRSALMLVSALTAINATLRGVERLNALNEIEPYRSRGKGQGGLHKSSNAGNHCNNAYDDPGTQGARERSRRMRQIERGIIQCT